MSRDLVEEAFLSQTNDSYIHGMSLRDYFAAKALQGMLSNSDWRNKELSPVELTKLVCQIAYMHADTMLEVR